jgi:DNA-binding transcriptional MerR regulator
VKTSRIIKIKDFSKLVGVSIKTIKKYQKKGYIEDKRLKNNYRFFTEDDVKNFIKLLKK